MAQLFKQMTVCGVGLIGGSLAMVARQQGLVGRIVGTGRTQPNLDVAVQRGIVDTATRDLGEAARGSDLIVLAVPILAMRAALEAMAAQCAPGAIVTDVGSVKEYVVRELEPALAPGMALVAAHPVAGKETTGAAAADPDLFRDRRVIVTPSRTSTAEATGKIEALWKATGARVERMEPVLHDALLARSSHLPQIISSALAAALADERVGGKLALEYGAGGLRDMTRLAASSWEMWRDIMMTNREAIADALRLFGTAVEEFQIAIESGDAAAMERIFRRGAAMRGKLR
jgi:prephenate dehydrogenase